jgi:hypothetical protein
VPPAQIAFVGSHASQLLLSLQTQNTTPTTRRALSLTGGHE